MPWWAYVAALVLFLLYLRRVGIIGLFYPLYLTRLGKWYFERGLAAARAEGPHSFAPPHSNGGPLQVWLWRSCHFVCLVIFNPPFFFPPLCAPVVANTFCHDEAADFIIIFWPLAFPSSPRPPFSDRHFLFLCRFHNKNTNIQVHVVPYSDDNYCYLIHDRVDNVGVVVDAGDAEAVADAMEAAGLDRIDAVLSTHKHWDHVCGNDGVVAAFPGTQVLAGEAVPSGTKMLVDGERVVFGTRIEVTARAVPCHTRGHMVYVVREAGRHDQPAWVFTGDSLFLAGVGRFFEGSAGEMYVGAIGGWGVGGCVVVAAAT